MKFGFYNPKKEENLPKERIWFAWRPVWAFNNDEIIGTVWLENVKLVKWKYSKGYKKMVIK